MFDDKAQIPGPSADQYHLMMIEPRSMKFDSTRSGSSSRALLPARTASRCSSTVGGRRSNEVSASVAIDTSGKITAEVKGAFGDTSGSLFGVFDLGTKTYVPFAGRDASLDRFVQLGDGCRCSTSGTTAAAETSSPSTSAHAPPSISGARSATSASSPDGRTLVLRIRLEPTADGYLREGFCFSTDGRSCKTSIQYRSPTPQHDP